MELWEHQKVAIEQAKNKPYYGLLFSMGTGKTCTIINILRDKFNENQRIMRTIIFTPSSVVTQFRQEWFKFSKIEKSKVICLLGSQKKRVETFMENKDKGCVFICNHESLLMKELYAQFVNWKPEAIVIDESHRFKSHDSKRSQALFNLANPIKQKKPLCYILTGTPILNSPLDIFQQMKIMCGGFPVEGQKIDNFYHFRSRYFYDKNVGMPSHIHFPDWKIKTLKTHGFDAVGEISSILSKYSMMVKKEDCLDLPEEMTIVHKVEMTNEQKKAYNELVKNLITYINDKECIASLAIVKCLRLMQVTSGYLTVGETDEEKENIQFKETPKDEILKELLEEITETSKVIVWCVFKFNYERIAHICEELGIKYVELHGGVSEVQKRERLDAFKQDESIRVFIGHPGSMGVGVNLTEAPYSIFYSRNFSLEHYLQARARNYRGGQTQKVTHYDLVCSDTIDEDVVEALSKKEEIGENILKKVAFIK